MLRGLKEREGGTFIYVPPSLLFLSFSIFLGPSVFFLVYTLLLLRGHFLPNRGHINKIVEFWPEIKNLCYNDMLWPISINEIFFAMKH